MVGKVSCAIAMTFQIKKSYVHDIAEDISDYILPENYDTFSSMDSDEDQLSKQQFVDRLTNKLLDFNSRFFENIEDRIASFSTQIK